MKSTIWLSVGSTLFLVHRQAYLLLFFLSEIIMATIPSLVQLSSVEVTKELTKKQSRMLEYKVRKYLPRNLKDIVRRQYLLNKQSDCDGNLLSSLIHDRVGQLDLSDMPCQNMDFLLLCPLLTKLNLRNALNTILNEDSKIQVWLWCNICTFASLASFILAFQSGSARRCPRCFVQSQ